MVQAEEHYYDDDPTQGHIDCRTRLKDVSYFFLGNGLIQAAVQISPTEGTAIGLLIMDPESLLKKRECFTYDSETGLSNTLIHLVCGTLEETVEPSVLEAHWDHSTFPAVHVQWHTEQFRIAEHFYCPDINHPILLREVKVRNISDCPAAIRVKTGIPGHVESVNLNLGEDAIETIVFQYTLNSNTKRILLETIPSQQIHRTHEYWTKTTSASFGSVLIDGIFNAAKNQIPAVISKNGRMDGSIWQYNREWVRDQAMVAVGLDLAGHSQMAGRILNRLLDHFVSTDGGTIDSSEVRKQEDVELDQNGVLLWSLHHHILWNGDRDLLQSHWDKIEALARFPLQKKFRHKSGLLANTREYWERHRLHGIQKGFEAAHQFWTILGLKAASSLAEIADRPEVGRTWLKESDSLRKNYLDDKTFSLIQNGHLIKRKNLDGTVQDRIQPLDITALPKGVPLRKKQDHFLDPDTSVALPIAFELISADSSLAAETLKELEELWDQGWDGGGYGRYHISSEPDSPGAWPFPSLFMARAYLEMGQFDKVTRILRWLGSIDGCESGSWFEFYGPRISPPFPQVGIPPWTWAEILMLFVHHMIGIRPSWKSLSIRPKLLPELEKIEIGFPLRKNRIHLTLRQQEGKNRLNCSHIEVLEHKKDEIVLAYPERDCTIDFSVS